jgi:transposase
VAVDLRKSYDGLAGCAQQVIGLDPLTGHLFVFFNRRRTLVKVLMWDRTGYCLFCKRLEQGRFNWLWQGEAATIDFAHLLLLLEGIDLAESRQRKRFRLPG